jgi:hypothetical protein
MILRRWGAVAAIPLAILLSGCNSPPAPIDFPLSGHIGATNDGSFAVTVEVDVHQPGRESQGGTQVLQPGQSASWDFALQPGGDYELSVRYRGDLAVYDWQIGLRAAVNATLCHSSDHLAVSAKGGWDAFGFHSGSQASCTPSGRILWST